MEQEIRFVSSKQIEDAVAFAFEKANYSLSDEIRKRLQNASETETSLLSNEVISCLIENLSVSDRLHLPICQDTGAAVVFAEIGKKVHILGDSLTEAVNRGVSRAYTGARLRCSMVDDPLYYRTNTGDNTPAFLHVEFTEGDRLILTCMPKGFGSENMSAIKMFSPSAGEDDVVSFVKETVLRAGGRPCPPLFLGIGIGGTFDTVPILAKKALALIGETAMGDEAYDRLGEKIEKAVNETGVGAQGFGGDLTTLGVKILHAPTHIAGLPVAVCVSCHACRHYRVVI